jgi:PhnB protein
MARQTEEPLGYQPLIPFLAVPDASEAITFYKTAFGAVERFRVSRPDGKLAHSELQFGEAVISVTDAIDVWPGGIPSTSVTPAITLLLSVPDVDQAFAHAVESGSTALRPVSTLLFGQRAGVLKDPFGHCWILSTHVEEVSPTEMQRRLNEAFAKHIRGT